MNGRPWSVAALLAVAACAGAKKKARSASSCSAPAAERRADRSAATPDGRDFAALRRTPRDGAAGERAAPRLLSTQCAFVTELQPDGTTKQKPGPATLIVLRQAGGQWEAETIEDPDSNVSTRRWFGSRGPGPRRADHRRDGCVPQGVAEDGEDWRRRRCGTRRSAARSIACGTSRSATSPATGSGSSSSRTHDQGVVGRAAPGRRRVAGEELDRRPGIFVHESRSATSMRREERVFFTTRASPTRPAPSAGRRIDMYRWDGSTFARTPVMWSDAATPRRSSWRTSTATARPPFSRCWRRRPRRARLHQGSGDGPVAHRALRARGKTVRSRSARRDAARLHVPVPRWGDGGGDGTNELVARRRAPALWLAAAARACGRHGRLIDADRAVSSTPRWSPTSTATGFPRSSSRPTTRRVAPLPLNAGSKSFDRETIFDLAGPDTGTSRRASCRDGQFARDDLAAGEAPRAPPPWPERFGIRGPRALGRDCGRAASRPARDRYAFGPAQRPDCCARTRAPGLRGFFPATASRRSSISSTAPRAARRNVPSRGAACALARRPAVVRRARRDGLRLPARLAALPARRAWPRVGDCWLRAPHPVHRPRHGVSPSTRT